jgi:hypothetical protein
MQSNDDVEPISEDLTAKTWRHRAIMSIHSFIARLCPNSLLRRDLPH